MHYPLIVVLPAGTAMNSVYDAVDEALAPFDESRDDLVHRRDVRDDEPWCHPDGKWESYTVGGRYTGFFRARGIAETNDLLNPRSVCGSDPCGVVTDGGRLRALHVGLGPGALVGRAGLPEHAVVPGALNTQHHVHGEHYQPVVAGAVLTHLGEWLSPQGVRFVTTRSGSEYERFVALASDYLGSIDDDWILVAVDCRT